ncbi:unnamed protein product [Oikopleura dioica]|uniref:PLAT domain-containing protein n=1 Tax=Oikopleura dioica TaxID=34765 RepID=E4YNY8_OIKDI|nr:unnamed protein product [Oikopleura dioica]
MKICVLFLNAVFAAETVSSEAADSPSTTKATSTSSELLKTDASSSIAASSTTSLLDPQTLEETEEVISEAVTETAATEETPSCPAVIAESVEYKMKITTTGDLFAGTDDPVYIMFNGENVSTNLVQIPEDSKSSDFERGQTDEFYVTVTGVDDIKSATIIKPGNDRWYVEDFSLTLGNSTIEFDCFKTRVDGSQKPLVCMPKENTE